MEISRSAVERYIRQQTRTGRFRPSTARQTRYLLGSWLRHVGDWEKPQPDEVVEWVVPMFFTGAWPGTESGQTFGQTGDSRLDPATAIQNCYLVGMDVKGSGVAGDLIPLGVRRLLSYLR